jgi:hypothetical protein
MTDLPATGQRTVMSWRNGVYLILVAALTVMGIVYHNRLLATLVFPLSRGDVLEFYALIYIVIMCGVAFFPNKNGWIVLSFSFLPLISNYYFAIFMELSTLNMITSDGSYLIKYQGYTFLIFSVVMNAIIFVKALDWRKILAYNFAVVLSISIILYQYLKIQNVL